MPQVFCYECSLRTDNFVRHEWPPCDLNADGTAKDPLPCGHRRFFRTSPEGKCAECARQARRRAAGGPLP
jgi:hypothetical protein